jgi:hypothetical protein
MTGFGPSRGVLCVFARVIFSDSLRKTTIAGQLNRIRQNRQPLNAATGERPGNIDLLDHVREYQRIPVVVRPRQHLDVNQLTSYY